jgi:hypothetical protein
MHFWDIDGLADELKSGKLTETQAFKYYVTVTILQMIPFVIPMRSETLTTFYSLGFGSVFPIVWLATALAGLILCFRANQRADGKDFIQRMICLELPAGIRTMVFCIPLIFIGVIIRSAFPKEDSHIVAFWTMGIVLLVSIIVQYGMIYRRLQVKPHSQAGPERAAA